VLFSQSSREVSVIFPKKNKSKHPNNVTGVKVETLTFQIKIKNPISLYKLAMYEP